MEKKQISILKNEDPFEVIYFGSPNKTVNFSFVEGKKLKYSQDLFVNKNTNQTLSSSLLYKFPLRHLGQDYENFYMVAVPCNDILCRKFDNEYDQCDNTTSNNTNNISNNKNILDKCMIKIRKDLNGDYTGYQSGCRSAIVKFENKYYRLKGCGNLDKGFNEREMGFPKGAIDLRGCQFHHTAFREVYMSDKINKNISKFGFEVSNKPIGLWLYGDVKSDEKGLKDDRKRIDKFCSIYETHSEKRLGCQLLPGLEIIVFEFIIEFLKNNKNNNCDVKEIISELFNPKRVIRKKPANNSPNISINKLDKNGFDKNGFEDNGFDDNQFDDNKNTTNSVTVSTTNNLPKLEEIIEIEETTTFIPIIELCREEGDNINSLFDKYCIYTSDEEMLINLNDLLNVKHEGLKLNPILSFINNPDLLSQIINNYFEAKGIFQIFTDKINSEFRSLINNKLDKLVNRMKDDKFHLLEIISLIFSRVGWESGRLKRIMQDKNINWGTYEDQPYRLHCNAHTDNYTINQRGWNKNKNILSILDFDLAFFRDNFINISDESKDKFGFPDDFLFDSYLNLERQHLEWEFAGLENVLSFDFYKEEIEKDKNFDFISKALFNLLRDTSVIYFREGYLLKEFTMGAKYEELYEDIYDMIEIALFISHDFMDKPF